MGQTVSRPNKKSSGSTVFAYTTTSVPSIYIKKTDEIKHQDNVLFNPFLYGLAPNGSNDTVTTRGRTDSGFLQSGKECQLWKDLMYVDQTYYSPAKAQELLHKADEVQVLLLGDTLTFKDVASTSHTMQDIDLSKRELGLITPNIGLWSMIRRLDLSHNQLKELPEAIGLLQQLESLSVSHNQITILPDTICHLVHLTDFNLSHNQLQCITPFIRHLNRLQTLQLAHNRLQRITPAIESLCNLTLLDLSYNPITILPAEITQLPFLRRLRLDGCPFSNSLDQTFKLAHDPPSLLEICARHVVKNEHQILSSGIQKKRQSTSILAVDTLKSLITDSLYHYLSSFNACSHCHGPYFESFVTRGRWIERNDIWVPLEYRLCSAHWSDESDRLYAVFSASQTPSSPKAKGSETATASLLKLKPGLPILQAPLSKKSLLVAAAAPLPPLPPPSSSASATRRSCFNNTRRSSSVTTPPTMMLSTTAPLQINQDGAPIILDPTTSSSSAVKRWRIKVRNNSSLFMKTHRLY